jgi:hypothetical protein
MFGAYIQKISIAEGKPNEAKLKNKSFTHSERYQERRTETMMLNY